MDRIIYKIQDYSKSYLQNHGFKYSPYLSDYVDEIYTYRFPLISYNKVITISCEIAISTVTGIVNVNVLNGNTRDLYASYYDREYGNYEIIKLIDIKINNKLKELGIEQL